MSHAIDADDRVSQVAILIKLNRALYRLQVRHPDSGANVGAADGLITSDNSRNCINHYQRRIVRGQIVVAGLLVPPFNKSARPILPGRSIKDMWGGSVREPTLGGRETGRT
jgi:hypothetical protein